MDALDLLLNRVSVPRLFDPAPDAAQRDVLFRAALRAPDHGQLRPWRFLTVEGDARQSLGELFVEALQAKDANTPPATLDKARNNPLRAPLVVVAIARLTEHFKVPQAEQTIAAACAAHGIVLAAHAQGLGAVWRTGELSYDAHVEAGLGLGANERIIGFIYLGSVQGERRTPPVLDPADFVAAWPA
jgi:nitroreductase